MIQFEYINPLKQYGKVEYDLILTDSEDPIFYYRFGRKFNALVSQQELADEGRRTILQLEADLVAQAIAAPKEVLIQSIKDHAIQMVEDLKVLPKDLPEVDYKLAVTAIFTEVSTKITETIATPLELNEPIEIEEPIEEGDK